MMSYNYTSGISDVITEPQAKQALSSKIQQCIFDPKRQMNPPPTPGRPLHVASSPPVFAPLKKPPACEFNFRTPNYFYPTQHTHTFKGSSSIKSPSKGIIHHPTTQTKNISYNETFNTSTSQRGIPKPQLHDLKTHGKSVSFEESALLKSPSSASSSYCPKSPVIVKPSLKQPQPIIINNKGPSSHPSGPNKPFYRESSIKNTEVLSHPTQNASGVAPHSNQSFYEESSFSTMTTSQSSSSSMPNNKHSSTNPHHTIPINMQFSNEPKSSLYQESFKSSTSTTKSTTTPQANSPYASQTPPSSSFSSSSLPTLVQNTTSYIPSTFKQPNHQWQNQNLLNNPTMVNYPVRNTSPIPYGGGGPTSTNSPQMAKSVPMARPIHQEEQTRTPSVNLNNDFVNLDSPSMNVKGFVPPAPPMPPKKPSPKNQNIGMAKTPFGTPYKPCESQIPKSQDGFFTPMESTELSPVIKETGRGSSPGEPIFLGNGEIIPSDTKIMVKDQNAWYRQMSKTIHGLKGDMPMNRVASWPHL